MLEFQVLRLRETHLYRTYAAENIDLHFEQ